MTPIDIRIKYKSETGLAPTYGRYKLTHGNTQSGCNYRGALTAEYVEWLETFSYLIGNREEFFKNTGLQSIYYDREHNSHYTRAYKEWLEEKACKFFHILEKWEKLAKDMETWD